MSWPRQRRRGGGARGGLVGHAGLVPRRWPPRETCWPNGRGLSRGDRLRHGGVGTSHPPAVRPLTLDHPRLEGLRRRAGREALGVGRSRCGLQARADARKALLTLSRRVGARRVGAGCRGAHSERVIARGLPVRWTHAERQEGRPSGATRRRHPDPSRGAVLRRRGVVARGGSAVGADLGGVGRPASQDRHTKTSRT